ncbi:hypothetical protein Pmani_038661 [Petrolisthes manimaculis]|uniref:USP domain-containing protein n=1 Tax=Petrolisthes manimaculis TaxID=1843537 RepID=A0AAE1TK19_9EUCA|nr:hypothetical protein Pmani_038661 [Petrolisthes manimaculis]
MKDKISNDLSYIKAGYRSDRWKWVLSLIQAGSSNNSKQAVSSKPTLTSNKDGQDQDVQEVIITSTDNKEKCEEDESVGGIGTSGSQPPESNGSTTEFLSSGSHSFTISEHQLTMECILKTFALDKWPKTLPCMKRCTNNPWCLVDLKGDAGKEKARPTDQPREPNTPVGLQNTANTCWINSALQALFHLPVLRNVINEVDGFAGEESLSSIVYLLQAMFVQMDTHVNKAIACSRGSIFEHVGLHATREIMRKDADHQVLKCVSEFLENTIDTLIADARLGPQLGPLFSTSLMRVARWRCPECECEQETELAPATSYTLAAYVSADECPLDQCLVDLQTETQTGVSLVCGGGVEGGDYRERGRGGGGCGARVKADRIVMPKIQSLPTVLVIRNNSLVDRDLKRRLHVVYPETLDLTPHTRSHVPATYTLAAVIYHHGHWVKHYSAHVKTGSGKWYSFNDEQVTELNNRSTSSNPQETHRNYFSLANVAQKYKHRPGLRVSRGAFVWVYIRSGDGGNTVSSSGSTLPTQASLVPPPEAVVEFVLRKQEESQNVNHQLRAEMQKEKAELLTSLQVKDVNEDVTLISEPLLSAWYCHEGPYPYQPTLLARPLCQHNLYSPLKCHLLKCVRAEGVGLLMTHRAGIQTEVDGCGEVGLPLTLTAEAGCCKACVARGANHILFIERVKALYRTAKKEARKEHEGPTKVVGMDTLEFWPRIALSAYVKEHGIDMEEPAEEVENGVDKKCEEGGRREGAITEEMEGIRVNGDKCDSGSEMKTANESATKSCDTTTTNNSSRNPVPDSHSESSSSTCDNRTGVVKEEMSQDIKNNISDKESTNKCKERENRYNKASNKVKDEMLSSKKNVDSDMDEKTTSSNKIEESSSSNEEKNNKIQESEEMKTFNEDIVCVHNLLCPTTPSCKLPQTLVDEIMGLCQESVHPAVYQEDFDTCPDCGKMLEESQRACESGRYQKKQLSNLYQEKKRPHPMRDTGRHVYLMDRDFFSEWKTYIRSCERGQLLVTPPTNIINAPLLCCHGNILFPVLNLQPHQLSE